MLLRDVANILFTSVRLRVHTQQVRSHPSPDAQVLGFVGREEGLLASAEAGDWLQASHAGSTVVYDRRRKCPHPVGTHR
jgi:hypothetical protein